jgi:hypothetical protein
MPGIPGHIVYFVEVVDECCEKSVVYFGQGIQRVDSDNLAEPIEDFASDNLGD